MQSDQITITNNPICPGRISPFQYGQFMEYLCDLFPGMWAEKLYDGSFEGLSPYGFDFVIQKDNKEQPWYPSGAVNRAQYSQDKTDKVNGETSEKIFVPGNVPATVGISQDGLAVSPSDPCTFSVWLRSDGAIGEVHMFIRDQAVKLAEAGFHPTTTWTKFTAHLTPKEESHHATLSIEFKGPGTLWIDMASLMPDKTVGGWRPDVVQALKDLKPGIIRFGGALIDDRGFGNFDWTQTLGDPDKRKPFRSWGGLQKTGPGVEEFVQLCQAVHAEPLMCTGFVGRTPKDAADEIEYFNGPASSPMGAKRAGNGHVKPYNIKYWQVGNELAGAAYDQGLPAFCDAMRAKDPSIKIMSSFPTEGVVKSSGDKLDYICPHDYDCANLAGVAQEFQGLRNLIGAKKIKLGITEWNTTAGDRGLARSGLWNLKNALACSRFQNLMHRNADLVDIANRSNLTNSFCSGIIQTDTYRLYKTPTYFAQMMYAIDAGTRPLQINPPAPYGPGIDVSATLSDDGSTLTLFCVNDLLTDESRDVVLPVGRWKPDVETIRLGDLQQAGEPDVTNSFITPNRVGITTRHVHQDGGKIRYQFPKLSLTMLKFTKE